ncbi:hypothetical protein NMY22_g14715 [Coprinellus aureogranulatus]|nr:hypothetical protein NMY22_g14715 [Coprinellus aureogranulatus]
MNAKLLAITCRPRPPPPLIEPPGWPTYSPPPPPVVRPPQVSKLPEPLVKDPEDLRQEPPPLAQVPPPLNQVSEIVAETSAEQAHSDHVHLSGSISSFEDLEDRVSEYDILDKSDLDSIAASMDMDLTGSEFGHEDDDDDIVDVVPAGPRLTGTGNEGLESALKGKDGMPTGDSDEEEDFECIEMPEA